jgi:uncharacterized protein (DUF2236 family)
MTDTSRRSLPIPVGACCRTGARVEHATNSISRPIKDLIAAKVSTLFNDTSKAETPVMRRSDGLFGPRSVAWRVHGDLGCMMVGGIAALLLQMLHPAVLAGVWDHSSFRTDMYGRLRRTARFIGTTTYGARAEAEASITRIRSIHDRVRGLLPDGAPYEANDPASLGWVHLAETSSFLKAWIRYGEPGMSRLDQDRYFAEMAQVAIALGAAPVPYSRLEAERLITEMRNRLRADERTHEIAQRVLNPPPATIMSEPLQILTLQAGVDLLPDWARRLHNLPNPMFARPLVRFGAQGMIQTLRWAFN